MIELLLMDATAIWLTLDTVQKVATARERRERQERERLVKKLAQREALEERAASRASITWSPPRRQRRDRGEGWHRSPKQRREDYQRAKSFLLD
jgi:hypothetical protein